MLAADIEDKNKLKSTSFYPDIYDPTTPYPLYKVNPIFPSGCLTNNKGEAIEWNQLFGKSVALFFTDFSEPKTRNVIPALVQMYRVLNETSSRQKVEIVDVPLCQDEELVTKFQQSLPWLSIKCNDPIIDIYKNHYRTMHVKDLSRFGFGPRHSPPTLFIIKSTGHLYQILNVFEEGISVYRKWNLEGNKF